MEILKKKSLDHTDPLSLKNLSSTRVFKLEPGGGGVQPQKTQKTQNYHKIPFWVLGFFGFFGF